MDAAHGAPPEFMTAEQVAGLLLLPRSTVEAYARSGGAAVDQDRQAPQARTDGADFIEGLRLPSARARRRSG